MPLWTQQITVAWQRPVVAFVSQHGSILQALDEAGLVRRFHVGEDRVGVKLADGLHHLVFSSEYLSLVALTKELDEDVLAEATHIVNDGLNGPAVQRAEINFRFIDPVQGGYDDVRREAGKKIAVWPDEIQNVDFAASFDLASEALKAEMHIEYGIVEPKEAAERLAFDQPAVVEDAEIHPGIFPLKSLPETGLYNGQQWHLSDVALSGAAETFDLWSRARTQAHAINMSISDRLFGEANEHGN